MPPPLGEIHHWLHDELAWLHLKWYDYRRLFAGTQERFDLLNKAAPDFFGKLQGMLWENVLLHLCRITDPPKTMKHDNLTIMRIPDAIPDPAIAAFVKQLVDDAAQKTQFARDWRNRRMAHQELPPLQGQVAKPLAPGSRQNVEDALAAVRKAMNDIEQRYLKAVVRYDFTIEALGGVESLIERLRMGLEAEDRES
jgi:hypothetical protein